MSNPMSLEGRAFLVTGAAQGIGRAVAELAVELGAKVALLDVNGDAVAPLAERLGPAQARAYVGSVADPAFVQEAVDDAVAQFGKLDGLVNNAGVIRPAMAEKMDMAAWQSVIEVNLTGVFVCLQAVGRHLLARARNEEQVAGSIVNVSSDAGRRGSFGQINYGAAKSGVLGITMSAAREWARHGVRVNSVCFGVVETAMTEVIRGDKFREQYMAQIPLGRFASPAEVAKPVCFLLSDGASYVTGQHLSINGGFHIGM